jgi:hypothetical protein
VRRIDGTAVDERGSGAVTYDGIGHDGGLLGWRRYRGRLERVSGAAVYSADAPTAKPCDGPRPTDPGDDTQPPAAPFDRARTSSRSASCGRSESSSSLYRCVAGFSQRAAAQASEIDVAERAAPETDEKLLGIMDRSTQP